MTTFAVYQNMSGLQSKAENWVKISDDFNSEWDARKEMKSIDADCVSVTGESMSNELCVM